MCCQCNVIKPQLKSTPARQKLITQSMGKVNFRKITSDTRIFKFYGQEMHHLTVANMNGPNSWICPETENNNLYLKQHFPKAGRRILFKPPRNHP